MLRLLLDENISYVVADGLAARRPDISIASLYRWREGAFMNRPDPVVLLAATEAGLTLVTFDQQTILPLVSEWGADGPEHAGVVFIDQRTVASHDFGGLIRALERLWDRERDADWTNRIDFLRLR
jgi:hypothetical protein